MDEWSLSTSVSIVILAPAIADICCDGECGVKRFEESSGAWKTQSRVERVRLIMKRVTMAVSEM